MLQPASGTSETNMVDDVNKFTETEKLMICKNTETYVKNNHWQHNGIHMGFMEKNNNYENKQYFYRFRVVVSSQVAISQIHR